MRRGDKLPFLIDFGAVKEAIATEVNQNTGSTFSASIGTPGYMSSEQAAGRPIYSSDLYSLGLTAIFLLTGKSPHELETDPRSGEIVWQEYAFNLDSGLAGVIDKAIRFHPRDRFPTAKAMLDALQYQTKGSKVGSLTGLTLNVAPDRTHSGYASQDTNNTFAYEPKQPRKQKKRGLLTTIALFFLIAIGVAAGTFVAGFAVISSLLGSPEPAEEEIEPTRQPDLFSANETEAQKRKAKAEEARKAKRQAAEEAKLAQEEAEAEQAEQASVTEKPPKTLAKVDLEDEINIPILTTGTSESQLVSTLGQPNSERRGWGSNSKVLVYYDVIPDRVNLSYQSDDTGKIRQTDIALDRSVGLGTMQDTLARMLGGDAPAGIKDKLRSVYDRQTNFSFFKLNDLEGKVQQDSRDRINISVWDKGFQPN